MLILTKSDLEELLCMDDVIEVLESAFKDTAEGKVTSPLRTVITMPEGAGWMAIMPAYSERFNSLSTKVITYIKRNVERNLPLIIILSI